LALLRHYQSLMCITVQFDSPRPRSLSSHLQPSCRCPERLMPRQSSCSLVVASLAEE
jgi:hypothetical protein